MLQGTPLNILNAIGLFRIAAAGLRHSRAPSKSEVANAIASRGLRVYVAANST
jgi:hypothetical protein